MDATPNLSLPYIMAAQSQKHVTHNEAIRALDAILQLAVLDRDLTAPPSSPADGARYIVGGSPTGAWSGHAGSIAAYQDGAWMFYAPVEGWIAWIGDEDAAVVWDGSAWSALTTGGGGSGSYSTLGINATADTTNRLTLAADATLLNHDGDGHQLKINKASAADTASLLYQDAFSGRAELGLAGDDDFHFKVSADGTTWKEAILIDRSTGSVSFPHTSSGGGSGRELLTANRTYYVRTDGSDSNTGLVDSSGGAFLTKQKAFDVIKSTLDLAGYTVTIKMVTGTYAGSLALSAWSGGGSVALEGDTANMDNVVLSAALGVTVASTFVGTFTVNYVKFTGTTINIDMVGGGGKIDYNNVNFAGAAVAHIRVSNALAICEAKGNYAISASPSYHVIVEKGGWGTTGAFTVTLTGTPAWGTAFLSVDRQSHASSTAITFSGASTGKRYSATLNSVIETVGSGVSYFPGNSAGTTATGAQYG